MRKLLLFTLLFCFIATFAQAQFGNRRRHRGFGRRRSPYRYEMIASLGATNFLGDLGGADQIGTHGFKDLNLVVTRAVLGYSMRWKLQQYIAVKGNFYWATLRGNDNLTKEEFRNNRNLSFKSNIFELSGQAEFNFIKEQKGHIYRISGVRGMAHKDRQIYLFAGGGGLHFNPKAKYLDGKYYALQPLGTEGEGLPGFGPKYSRFTYMGMMGLGARFAINRYWGVGMELGMRWTHSDYLDDVSTNYATQALRNAGASAQAIYFADPSQGKGPHPESVCEGCQRGDPTHKDAYMFALFTAGYKVMYKKRSRSKF